MSLTTRLLLAVAALVVVGGLVYVIAANTYWKEETEHTPLQGEARSNPFYTAQRLVAALGARSERRESLGQLPPTDAVMVLTNWHWDLISSRRKQLQTWVQNGGRLLLDRQMNGAESFKDWAGLELRRQDPDDEDEDEDEDADAEDKENQSQSDDADAEQEQEQEPREYQPTTAATQAGGDADELEVGCDRLKSDASGRNYHVCKLGINSWLEAHQLVAWSASNKLGIQAARVRIGRGSVALLNALPFDNVNMLRHDHGKLFVTLTQLKAGDLVVFMSEENHASLLALIWLYGAPTVLLTLLLLALALWRGALRFGPLAAGTESARRSLAEQIRGTGLFALQFADGPRKLHAAMTRSVDEAAVRRIGNYHGLTGADRVAALARTTGLDADKLAAAIAQQGTRNNAEWQQAIALLETARRELRKPR
jgi:hypothetical protein